MNAPIKLVQNEPRQILIDHIESLLEDAKEGRMRSVAYACVYAQQETGNGWCGIDEEKGDGTALIGEVGVLRARLENGILRKYFSDEVST